MIPMRPARQPLRGLTLVEVVVALAVLSLIVLALGASLRGLSQSAERVDQRAEAIDEMRVGIGFLREVLARTSRIPVPGPEPRLLFEGGADSLAWVAVMPARFGASGRFVFRLAVEPLADGTPGLVLRFSPWLAESPGFPDWAQAESRVLAHDVERASLAYGGEGLAAGWQPAWTDKDRLPPRVRLDLALTAGNWPPVVLPVRSAAGPTSVFTVGGGAR
jgi:general secretion pathway protein J